MHIPESRVANAEVGHKNGEHSSHDVGDEAVVEELFRLEYKGRKEGIGGEVTELEGKSLEGESHEVEGVIMEEQNQHEEKAYAVSDFKALESEDVVDDQSDDKGRADPNEVVGAEPLGSQVVGSEEAGGGVYGGHDQQHRRNTQEVGDPLLGILEVEHVAIAYVQDDGDHDGQSQLSRKEGVSEFGGQMVALARGIQEVLHEVLIVHCGEDGEGEGEVSSHVAEETVLGEYRRCQYRVVGVVAPTKDHVEEVGLLVANALEPASVDDVCNGV